MYSFRSTVVVLLLIGGIGVTTGKGGMFAPPYYVQLGALRADGDLALREHLCRVSLPEICSFEVYLDHRLITNDYGDTRSTFALLPFESHLCRHLGTPTWLTPGGTTVQCQHGELEKLGSETRLASMWTHLKLDPESICDRFHIGDILILLGKNDKWAWAEEGRWGAYYINGILDRFHSPEGRWLDVVSVGDRIARISDDGKILVEVYWSGDRVDELWTPGEQFKFLYDGYNPER